MFIDEANPYYVSNTHEWYEVDGLTEWATREDFKGISLPDIRAFLVKSIETGERDYVLLEKGNVIYDSKRYEDVAVRIDILKLQKQF